MDVVPVCVPLVGDAFDFDPERLRAALTDRTRAVIVNTPANPSGKIFTRADLEALAEVLSGTDVFVFTDEVYEHMCFDGRTHLSPAAVPALADRTLTIGGYSKTFSVTGWRIGYLAGPARAPARRYDLRIRGPPTWISQHAPRRPIYSKAVTKFSLAVADR